MRLQSAKCLGIHGLQLSEAVNSQDDVFTLLGDFLPECVAADRDLLFTTAEYLGLGIH